MKGTTSPVSGALVGPGVGLGVGSGVAVGTGWMVGNGVGEGVGAGEGVGERLGAGALAGIGPPDTSATVGRLGEGAGVALPARLSTPRPTPSPMASVAPMTAMPT